MAAREFLWIVKESALGTVMSTPVAGTDSMYIRLADGNAFSMVAEPIIEEIAYGGGFAVCAEAISDHYSCKGVLKTKLYPSQAAMLLGWWITRINSGQTAPWVTTEPAGDLASCSVYHAVRDSTGTYKRTRFAGVKVDGGQVSVSRKANSATLTLNLTASRSYGNAMDASADPDATEFPAPAESAYPTNPYTFRHTSGLLKIASTRTQYESLDIKVDNVLDPQWFETAYLTALPCLGRKSSLDANLYFKLSPDDRASYEAITAQDTEVTFSNGTNTCKIDFNGKNHITKLPYELPLNTIFMQKLSLMNRWDPAVAAGAGGDVFVTFT
jgi:hypothetical protein